VERVLSVSYALFTRELGPEGNVIAPVGLLLTSVSGDLSPPSGDFGIPIVEEARGVESVFPDPDATFEGDIAPNKGLVLTSVSGDLSPPSDGLGGMSIVELRRGVKSVLSGSHAMFSRDLSPEGDVVPYDGLLLTSVSGDLRVLSDGFGISMVEVRRGVENLFPGSITALTMDVGERLLPTSVSGDLSPPSDGLVEVRRGVESVFPVSDGTFMMDVGIKGDVVADEGLLLTSVSGDLGLPSDGLGISMVGVENVFSVSDATFTESIGPEGDFTVKERLLPSVSGDSSLPSDDLGISIELCNDHVATVGSISGVSPLRHVSWCDIDLGEDSSATRLSCTVVRVSCGT
jgi:hypothetical protein